MTNRDRDLSVERWLRQTPVAGAESAACLDADTLAAWAEGLLNVSERASAEAHASSCGRCQAMLAVMVRTMPVAPPPSASPMRKWLMMLSPALAAGAAVALWFAVDQGTRVSPVERAVDSAVNSNIARDQARVDQASKAPQSAAAAGASEKSVESPARALDRQASGPEDARRNREAPKELTDALRDREERSGADKKSSPTTLAKARGFNERKDEAPAPPASPVDRLQAAAGDRAAQVNAAPTAPLSPQANANQNQSPSQNQNQNQNQAPSPNANQAQGQVSQRLQTGVPAPAPAQAPAAPPAAVVAEPPVGAVAETVTTGAGAGRRGRAGQEPASADLFVRTKIASLDVVSSDPLARWRVVDGGIVQRSLDAGATWTNQYRTTGPGVLTAGAAPTATVCWLVGRGGLVLLTTDGQEWRRVTFPEPVDLTAVTSTDARTASVTTANGRRFSTTDGGRNWTPR